MKWVLNDALLRYHQIAKGLDSLLVYILGLRQSGPRNIVTNHRYGVEKLWWECWIDRILNNILRSSLVFLTVDSGLLLELILLIARVMWCLYLLLWGLVHPYYEAMTPTIMIALSQLHHTISVLAWWLSATHPSTWSCSCNVVSKHHSANNNEAINRMISCQTMSRIELELRHHEIHLLLWLEHQSIIVGSAWSQIDASLYWLVSLHYRFNRWPTDTWPTQNMTHLLVITTKSEVAIHTNWNQWAGLLLVLAMVPNSWFSSGSGSNLQPDHCNGLYHTKTRTVAIGLILPLKYPHLNLTALDPIKNLSSDCIVRWSLCRLCSIGRSVTAGFQICDLTNTRWVAIEYQQILVQIWSHVTVIQWILIALQIWMWEVKELLKLHNLCIDHVTIRSELKTLNAAKPLPML